MKINTILDTLIVTLLVLLSGSIYIFPFFREIYIFSVLLLIPSIMMNGKYKKREYRLFFFIVLLGNICIFCNLFFSISSNIVDYIFISARFFYAGLVFFVLSPRLHEFVVILQRVLKFYCIVSLLGFIICIVFPQTRITVSIPKFGDSVTVGYFYFFHAIMDLGGIIIPRNQGIFWEPGVLAIYTNILLFISLFLYKKKICIILSTLVIVTTFSTSGFFMMTLQWIFFLFKAGLKLYYKILLCGLIIIPLAAGSFFSFLEKRRMAVDDAVVSYSLRFFDIYSSVLISIRYPLTGIGISKDAFFSERNKLPISFLFKNTDELDERGNSNSLFSLFYTWGIPFSLFLIYCAYRQNIFFNERYLFYLLFLFSLVTEPLFYSPFFLFIIYTGIRSVVVIVLKKLSRKSYTLQ